MKSDGYNTMHMSTEDVVPNSPLLQPCPSCAIPVDVSDEEPFSEVKCPACGAAMRARTSFNHFMLQELLGEGGMGAVYRAMDVNLNRLVALKVVLKHYSRDPAYHVKFEHEARITASINHPHVVKVYSFGSDHGLFYIAMELVDKGSLDEWILREGHLDEARVVETGIQVAQGLDAAFKRGLIHRDVKPGNILYSDLHTAKIVDFGLALPLQHGAEGGKPGEPVWGTPYYVAPEKLTYQPEDFRSDMYSLGATLFHALAGRPSFEGDTTSLTALRKLKAKPADLQAAAPKVSTPTAYVINRMLNMDPGERYQSYEELIEHLTYAHDRLLNKDVSIVMDWDLEEERSSKGKNKTRLLTLLSMLALAGAGGLWGLRDLNKQAVPPPKTETVPSKIGNVDDKYKAARRQLAKGDFQRAQRIFHDLAAQQTLAHPLDRWVALHEGLTALLLGRPKEGADIFLKLQQSGPFSTESDDRPLAEFFVNIGGVVVDKNLSPSAEIPKFKRDNYEALGLFIAGLRDWQFGKFGNAAAFFQAFTASAPKAPYEWIAEYKPLAEHYLEDYASYRKVDDRLKAANDLQTEDELLRDIPEFKASLQMPGRMVEAVVQKEEALQKKVSDEKEALARQAAATAARHDQDAKVLGTAQAKFAALAQSFQFAEAQQAVADVKVQDPDVARQRADLLKKANWLITFKNTLISDINTVGYPQAITKTNGQPLDGGVHVATDREIGIQMKYGTLNVPWTDVPPVEMLNMAGFFTGRVSAPDAVADRLWLSGVFASQNGMQKEAKALLELASRKKAAYLKDIPMFESGSPTTQSPIIPGLDGSQH